MPRSFVLCTIFTLLFMLACTSVYLLSTQEISAWQTSGGLATASGVAVATVMMTLVTLLFVAPVWALEQAVRRLGRRRWLPAARVVSLILGAIEGLVIGGLVIGATVLADDGLRELYLRSIEGGATDHETLMWLGYVSSGWAMYAFMGYVITLMFLLMPVAVVAWWSPGDTPEPSRPSGPGGRDWTHPVSRAVLVADVVLVIYGFTQIFVENALWGLAASVAAIVLHAAVALSGRRRDRVGG